MPAPATTSLWAASPVASRSRMAFREFSSRGRSRIQTLSSRRHRPATSQPGGKAPHGQHRPADLARRRLSGARRKGRPVSPRSGRIGMSGIYGFPAIARKASPPSTPHSTPASPCVTPAGSPIPDGACRYQGDAGLGVGRWVRRQDPSRDERTAAAHPPLRRTAYRRRHADALDTGSEIEYLRHNGSLPYVVRKALAGHGRSVMGALERAEAHR